MSYQNPYLHQQQHTGPWYSQQPQPMVLSMPPQPEYTWQPMPMQYIPEQHHQLQPHHGFNPRPSHQVQSYQSDVQLPQYNMQHLQTHQSHFPLEYPQVGHFPSRQYQRSVSLQQMRPVTAPSQDTARRGAKRNASMSTSAPMSASTSLPSVTEGISQDQSATMSMLTSRHNNGLIGLGVDMGFNLEPVLASSSPLTELSSSEATNSIVLDSAPSSSTITSPIRTPRAKRRQASVCPQPQPLALPLSVISPRKSAVPSSRHQQHKSIDLYLGFSSSGIVDSDMTPTKAIQKTNELQSSPFPAPPISGSSPAVGHHQSDPEEMGRFLGGGTVRRGGHNRTSSNANSMIETPLKASGPASGFMFDTRLKNRLLGQGHDGGYLISPLQDAPAKFATQVAAHEDENVEDEGETSASDLAASSSDAEGGFEQAFVDQTSTLKAMCEAPYSFSPTIRAVEGNSMSWSELSAKLSGDLEGGLFTITPGLENPGINFPPMPLASPSPHTETHSGTGSRKYPTSLGSGLPGASSRSSRPSIRLASSVIPPEPSSACSPFKGGKTPLLQRDKAPSPQPQSSKTPKKRAVTTSVNMKRTTSLQLPMAPTETGPIITKSRKRSREVPLEEAPTKPMTRSLSTGHPATDPIQYQQQMASAFTTRPLSRMPARNVSMSSAASSASWESPISPGSETQQHMLVSLPQQQHPWSTGQMDHMHYHMNSSKNIPAVSGISTMSCTNGTPALVASGESPLISHHGNSPVITPGMAGEAGTLAADPLYYGHPIEYEQHVQISGVFKKLDGLMIDPSGQLQRPSIRQHWSAPTQLPHTQMHLQFMPQHEPHPHPLYPAPAAHGHRHASAYQMQQPPPQIQVLPREAAIRSVSDIHRPMYQMQQFHPIEPGYYGMSTIQEEESLPLPAKKPKMRHPIVGTRLKPGPRPKSKSSGGDERQESVSASAPSTSETIDEKPASAVPALARIEKLDQASKIIQEPQPLDKSYLEQCFTAIMIPDEMSPILSVKRYQCKLDGCGRIFPRKSAVYSHIQTHLEHKPFVCPAEDW